MSKDFTAKTIQSAVVYDNQILEQELQNLILKFEEIESALQQNALIEEARLVKSHLEIVRKPEFKKTLSAKLSNKHTSAIIDGVVLDFADELL